MHAPFVFAAVQRAGPVDNDLAFAQGQRPAIQKAAGTEFLPGAGMARHHPEQHQRWRAAHDPVELLLDILIIGWLQRRDAWHGLRHHL
jgi:hypothetical protein